MIKSVDVGEPESAADLPLFIQGEGAGDDSPNTALIHGVHRFAMDVRELDIDLIDRVKPFGEVQPTPSSPRP